MHQPNIQNTLISQHGTQLDEKKKESMGRKHGECNPVHRGSYIDLDLKQNSISYDLIMWFESFNDAICCRYYNGLMLKVRAPSAQEHRFVSNILNWPDSKSHANEAGHIENTFKAHRVALLEFHNNSSAPYNLHAHILRDLISTD